MTMDIRLLGQFEARMGGSVPLRLPTRKAEALLAMLAAKPSTRHRRDHLARLLWPQSDNKQARGSLRQTLNLLRKALGDTGAAAINTSGDDLWLEPQGISIDVQLFESGAAGDSAAAIEQACAHYRGDFLEGLEVEGEEFEDWRMAERMRLREVAIGALSRLLEHQLAEGAADKAIAAGERLLALDPAAEVAYRALMQAYLTQGARGGAIRQYQRCRKILRRELAVDPSAETEALYKRIIDGAAVNDRLPARDRPSIAVLPFDAPPIDGETYFAQGVVDDILSELSRFRSLRVIARHSSFSAARLGRSAGEIGKELGADFVLEGSIRRIDSQMRIATHLSSTASGLHISSDRFDVPVKEVFELEDRIVRQVAGALAVRIDSEILERAQRRNAEDQGAYDYWLQAMYHLHRDKPRGVEKARKYFQRAIDIDPNYARAYSGMALTHYNDWNCHNWDRWAECQSRAFEHARKATELDPSDHIPHCILGQVHIYRREFELAEKHHARSLSLNPNDADCLARMAQAQCQLGDPAAGIELGEAARRLNPRFPDWYVGFLGLPYMMAGRPEEAVAVMEQAPDAFIDTRGFLAAAYGFLNNKAKVREHGEAFLEGFQRKIVPDRKAEPEEAVRWLQQVTPFRQETDARYFRKGLKKTGLLAT
jgi:DNA-binding SARP family transcriptional activator